MGLDVIDASGATKTLDTGSGSGSSGSPFKSPLAVAFGLQADSQATSDTGTFSFLALFKRLLRKFIGADNVAIGRITVNSTPTVVATANTERRAITIINHGTTDVFVGTVNTMSTSTGCLLPGIKGAALTWEYTGNVYAIVASGTQAISCFEEY